MMMRDALQLAKVVTPNDPYLRLLANQILSLLTGLDIARAAYNPSPVLYYPFPEAPAVVAA